jgi:hypothetical protein
MKSLVYLTILAIVLSGTQLTIAQPFKNAMELNVGRSFHGGSADLSGLIVDFSHFYRFRKHIGLVSSLASTMHFRSDIYSPFDRYPDYYTTAGVQLSASIRFSFDLAKAHEFHLSVGPLIRFQADSNPNLSSATYDPNSTNDFKQRFEFESQTSLSPGYIVVAGYTATIKSKLRLGARIYFQNDTGGDVITCISPSIGLLFK